MSLRTLTAALRTFSGAGLGIAVISATPSATPEATSRIGGRTYGVGSKSSAKVLSLLPARCGDGGDGHRKPSGLSRGTNQRVKPTNPTELRARELHVDVLVNNAGASDGKALDRRGGLSLVIATVDPSLDHRGSLPRAILSDPGGLDWPQRTPPP